MKQIQKSPEIGRAFNEGFALYKENFGLCLLAVLLACLVSGATFGICSGPMSVGLSLVLLRILRKDPVKPQAGDVFKGFNSFLPSFLVWLVLGIGSYIVSVILNIVPILGFLVGLVLSIFVVPAAQALAIYFVADQRATAGEAIGGAFKLLGDGRFWMFALIAFVAGIVGALGLVVCVVGVIFTIPLAALIIASAYEQMYGGASETEPVAAIEPPSGEPPAAPEA